MHLILLSLALLAAFSIGFIVGYIACLPKGNIP